MPVELPPAPPAIIRELQQAPQLPIRIPESDLVVEVAGELPVRTQLTDVSRLLGRRQMAHSSNRVYPPTILELIMLVERNPAKPHGRAWNSIRALIIGYDVKTKEVRVEYCLDYCDTDPKTGAAHPRRKVIAYTAPEQVVLKRMNKKLAELKKYSAAPR